MNRLVFPTAAIQFLIDHARAAPTSRPILDDCFVEPGADLAHLKPGAKPDAGGFVHSDDVDAEKLPKGLLLVKDRGAYLMSGGNPPLLKDNGKGHEVVYATGCDPRKDVDWYDDVYYLCGGDDFIMRVELSMLDRLLEGFTKKHGQPPSQFRVGFESGDRVIFEVC